MTSSITEFEVKALGSEFNFSDGHPRMALTSEQEEIIDQLPNVFRSSGSKSVRDLERTSRSVFLKSIGQDHALDEDVNFRSCYSSSTAIDIVGKALAQTERKIAMVEPTFDNLHDLLEGHRLQISAVAEKLLQSGPIADGIPLDGALFIVSPNNPSGLVISQDRLAEIADLCYKRNCIIIIDSCFRAQDLKAQYDTYETLRQSGANWIVIEDTGKLWPLQELKVGFLNWNSTNPLPLARMYSDHLLSASPFILSVVKLFALDGQNGGYAKLRSTIARNREIVRDVVGLEPVQKNSNISVDLFELPSSLEDEQIYNELKQKNIHILPGRLFYWSRPELGSRYIRVSLARDEGGLREGCQSIREFIAQREALRV